MPLTAEEAHRLALRLLAAGHDVDRTETINGTDWRVSVKRPDNNFDIYVENVRIGKDGAVK